MASSRSLCVVTVVLTLVSIVCGSVCQMPSGATGTCVEIDKCNNLPLLTQPLFSQEEVAYLTSQISACSVSTDETKMVCCNQEDIHTNRSEPTVFVSTQCLNGPADPPQSETTSFGAFIDIHDPTQNLSNRCFGSLIDAEYVLTSAHCVYETPSDSITVYINARNVTKRENGSISAGGDPSHVEYVFIHPVYTPDELGYDIALLRLKKAVQLSSSDSPQPICIPTSQKHYESENHILYSFGWASNAEDVLSDIRQVVMLKKISLPHCVIIGGELEVRSEVLTSSNGTNPICSFRIDDDNLVQGYTGAPLMYRKNGAWFLRGVLGVPWDKENRQNSRKVNRVLWTSVQYHAKWIEHFLHPKDTHSGGFVKT